MIQKRYSRILRAVLVIVGYVLFIGVIAQAIAGSGNSPPIADFYYSPLSPSTTDSITFTSNSSDDEGPIADFAWIFGDGGTSSRKNPVHSYNRPGSYVVKLTVTDENGTMDSCSKVLEIANRPPLVNFSNFPSSSSGMAVQLMDESQDPDGDLASWVWAFGDGASSQIRNPSHLYQSPGGYSVTLTVSDDSGASSSFSKLISVKRTEPPKIEVIEPKRDEVGRVDDFIELEFQLYEEEGIEKIDKLEVWVRDENGKTERYGNLSAKIVRETGRPSPYEAIYSFTFDPADFFEPGYTDLLIRAVNEADLEASIIEEDLLRVTGGNASVQTLEAEDVSGGKATLNASISYGDYSNVDVTFYYREQGDEKWKNTGWEIGYTSEIYSHQIRGLKPNTVYEYKAGIRFGMFDRLYDNGSMLSMQEDLGVMLIQSESVKAIRGDSTIISLEVANLLSGDIEAVRVFPPAGYDIMPSVRWIGSMEVDSYLPADFRLETSDLEDGEILSFYAVYRSSGETKKSPALNVTVGVEERDRGLGEFRFDLEKYFFVFPMTIVVLILLVVYLIMRR